MAEITTRGVPDEVKHAHMMMAGALGMTLNDWCREMFIYHSMSVSELRDVLLNRMESIHTNKSHKEFILSLVEQMEDKRRGRTVLPFDDIPKPDTTTQPFQGERWNKRK